ncbi:alpha/beta hydrolase [Spongiibacter sp. KMU-158]|uniref:Alpha/beta hydrolase n=1 Tax=Spongiibacter pelagi TaxID=2760804 RepID=A0A927C2C3_9GAMM|nr:alpha/beta hydrolase [Spongiibacter pelagi]MBD2858567.1 alpha/beta hydrolase [Spongiibacter pelagi]
MTINPELTSAPNSAASLAGRAEVQSLVDTFMGTDLAQCNLQQLAQWRPKTGSLWNRLQPFMAMQAGMRTHSVAVGDQQLCFWQGGQLDGPPLLLVHGFGASKENWVNICRGLGRTFRLIVPDLAGFGNSSFSVESNYRLDIQADRLALLLDELGIESTLLAGSSMGGGICAQLAARHPQKVAGLVLMNAAGAPAKYNSLLEAGLRAGVNYLSPADRAGVHRTFQICLHRRHRVQGALLALISGGEMPHRKSVNDFIFTHLVDSLVPTWDCLGGIKAPTFILWGDADQVLDSSCVDGFLDQIETSNAVILPECGHLPMLEEPGLTVRLVTDFWTAIRT